MIDYESLGITQEEVQKRLIKHLCETVMTASRLDEEDNDVDSEFAKKLHEVVQKQIDETIFNIAEKHILPKIAEYIENLTLQLTNQWGEKKGAKMTFIEYLTQRAENYLVEPVNYEGKAKPENYSSLWTGTQSRITYMIHEHLKYAIEIAMKDALKDTNSHIASGIEETVKIQLAELSKKIKIGVIST